MTVYAPFNFVPLASWVLYPEWSKMVSHDLPLKKGLCGTLGYQLTADTPILIGGEKTVSVNGQPSEISFFQLPDGRYAIPGSSLKGMIKNVLAIATYSRMKAVDDQKFSVRDLRNPDLYGRHMTDGDRNLGYRSKVRAGWLKFDNGQWHLFTAQYARVEQSEIRRSICPSFTIQPGTSAEDKYQIIRNCLTDQKVLYSATGEMLQSNHQRKLIYRKVTALGTGNDGYLVITGQPSPQKHMEFVFSKPGSEVTNLQDSVIKEFLFIHSETKEWKYLNSHSPFPPDFGIPVFYILQDDNINVRAIGLAQMFKLAYNYSVNSLISHSYKTCNDEQKDFIEALFGYVGETQAESLKGRVSFDCAVNTANTLGPMRVGPLVLSTPKASYCPIYIKQENEGDPYTTYMDDNAEIRGWKRYPVRPYTGIPPLSQAERNNTNIQVILYPLPAGTIFKGKIRFHNLMPEELGAIIWALGWGGNENLRHSLGMGKPFGLGQVRIHIDENDIIPNKLGDHSQGILECVKLFKDYMEAKCRQASDKTSPAQKPSNAPTPKVAAAPDWRDKLAALKTNIAVDTEPIVEQKTYLHWENSEQIKQLLAMAEPSKAANHELKYMSLGNGKPNDNEFNQAKNLHEWLPPYEP